MVSASLLPPEILSQIFIHCLSLTKYPTQYMQPDVTIAPMLLCQISSRWRHVALNTPRLWEVLAHTSYNPIYPPRACDWKLIRDVDFLFLEWWRSNLRNLPPSLCLRICGGGSESTTRELLMRRSPPHEPTNGPKYDEFFGSFIQSARILDLDDNMGRSLEQWLHGKRLECPHMETFLVQGSTSFDVFNLLPEKSGTPLQRLIMSSVSVRGNRPLHDIWHSLAHICLRSVSIHIKTWFTLIRQLSRVETAWFDIVLYTYGDFSSPSPATNDNLRQLHIAVDNMLEFEDRKKHLIFDNLRLPSLCALRIDFDMSLDGLDFLLQSTPALKELHLGNHVLYDEEDMMSVIPGPKSMVVPLSTLEKVPALEHVLLTLRNEVCAVNVANMLQDMINNPWLQLGQNVNNIKRVEACLYRGEDWEMQNFQDIDVMTSILRSMGVEFILGDPGNFNVWDWESRKADVHWEASIGDFKFHGDFT